ncbi:hypothetical protein GCM10009836_57490 [Pseudonocardia ailaonensis]|uniref:Uncharacterized protein n=1 Tax=Pseudonocardia ailaonensis TaxID=367279 RepID=A0ABN2NJG2_9PSEU
MAFRLFGRPEVPEIDPASATGQARPARRAEDLLAPRRPVADPPTDPHGFPAIGAGWERRLAATAHPELPSRVPHAGGEPGVGQAGGPLAASPFSAEPLSAGLLPAGPHSAAPHSAGPLSAGPLSAGPHSAAPLSAGSLSAVPHSAVPHSAGPPGGGPPLLGRGPLAAGIDGRAAAGLPGEPPRPSAPEPVPHPAEAAALGGAFAADYLSWDEDDPERRARVLGDYLAARRPVRLGWSGRGRQRADLALPGLVRPDGDGRVLVDVRVRVTPYAEVPGRRHPAEPAEDDGPAVPSAAPAPAARGWRGLPAQWVRLSVAVVVEGDRLVIDAEEEAEDPWPDPPVPDTDLESEALDVPDLEEDR